MRTLLCHVNSDASAFFFCRTATRVQTANKLVTWIYILIIKPMSLYCDRANGVLVIESEIKLKYYRSNRMHLAPERIKCTNTFGKQHFNFPSIVSRDPEALDFLWVASILDLSRGKGSTVSVLVFLELCLLRNLSDATRACRFRNKMIGFLFILELLDLSAFVLFYVTLLLERTVWW